jgi:hypothetical protein
MTDSSRNVIGGTAAGARNVISPTSAVGTKFHQFSGAFLT